MYESHGWWFPDTETHFPQMLKKSISKGGPAEYQYQVRNKSLTYVTQFRTGIDIGANVGLWSRSLVTKFQRVIAFEPVPLFRDCLQKNVSGNNFVIMPMALGDQDTTAQMTITQGNTGHTHIDPVSLGSGNVEVYRLDDLELDAINYIKIDCEGYEYRILQGAEQTIKKYRPIIVVEQKPHDAYSEQYSQHAAIALLQNWGMIRLDQVKDDWIMGWP